MPVTYYEGIGRRKESTARVRVARGNGIFHVNQKAVEKYFPRYGDLELIQSLLSTVGENRAQLDITAIVNGGGVTGQVSAVAMGLARALVLMNPDYRQAMRKYGFLTRDARIKERKKPGLKRARKAPTYTKR